MTTKTKFSPPFKYVQNVISNNNTNGHYSNLHVGFVNENHKVTKKRRSKRSRLFGRRNLFAFDLFVEDMRDVYSNSPPESTPLSDTSEQMPDFNNVFQKSVSKLVRVTNNLHQMVLLQSSNIRDLQNMMIGILILIIGLAILIIIGLLIFLILKYRNEKQKQKRRRRSNRGKYRFNDIRSEHLSVGNRYMNENSDAFMSKVHLFDDVLICGECRFRTNDIHKFADHKSHECLNIIKAPSEPKSIECCENTFKSSWKLLQHLSEKHNLNLYRDESTTDDSQEKCGPQPPSPLPSESVKSGQKSYEMLCNKNSPILYDSTDAHKMSKDYCIGEIVYEEKQTYDKKPISPTTTTSTTSGGFNGLNKNTASNKNTAVRDISNAHDNIIKIGTNKQTTFNQHNAKTLSSGTNIFTANNNRDVKQTFDQTTFNQNTTNFIVCCSDSLKPLNV